MAGVRALATRTVYFNYRRTTVVEGEVYSGLLGEFIRQAGLPHEMVEGDDSGGSDRAARTSESDDAPKPKPKRSTTRRKRS